MKRVMVALSDQAVETARSEASKAGITCLGTKVAFDIERYYENVRRRAARRLTKEVRDEG